ncbi:DUF2442 domain-containing protein [Burkholderiaceae bacterium FT117]|uniref:DUF2442 domain-containing protein n=1 Tax=Zeimonas sediminis TaxID=2944268 RepID=UPI0023432450|nr:DUF2442 domain-containing protein [Zeimonas sediminis]MCM5572010.1 DUF2442 domain-containing protein [Zeimonas sediminis]
MPGIAISDRVELVGVFIDGLRLRVGAETLSLSFTDFPWLREATIAQLANVQRPSTDHLYWPELDVDLSVESIRHPERFPLKAGMHR